MEHVLPAGKVFQAGTLSGNPIATAAGIAMLQSLRDDPPYEQLESSSQKLADGLKSAAEKAGVQCCLNRVGSMMTLFFNPGPVTDWDSAARCDTERFAKYFWGMIEQGIYMPCSQFEALFVSATHRDSDIEATIQAATEVLASI
jgi:glutamate-1-semialdehyde 2,1-aminomutase